MIKALTPALALLIPAAAQAATCRLEQSAEIPLTMLGNVPVADVRINDKPGQMIFDTGSASLMLSTSAPAKFNLPPTANPPKGSLTSSGVPLDVSYSHIAELDAFGVALKELDAPVSGDLGFDGLAGQALIGRDGEYDLTNRRVRFFTPAGCINPAQAHWPDENKMQVLMIPDRTRIFATVSVNGVELMALFDTGSPYSALTADAAARAGVHPGDPGVTQTHTSYGINGKVGLDTWVASFNDITFAGETVEKPRLEFILKHNYSADMILGADFFRAHRVLISKDQHRMYFQYNGAPLFGGAVKVTGN